MDEATKAFVDLVRRMRTARREYFRSRASAALMESKDLERRVDDAVKAFLAPPGQQQQEMFGG